MLSGPVALFIFDLRNMTDGGPPVNNMVFRFNDWQSALSVSGSQLASTSFPEMMYIVRCLTEEVKDEGKCRNT